MVLPIFDFKLDNFFSGIGNGTCSNSVQPKKAKIIVLIIFIIIINYFGHISTETNKTELEWKPTIDTCNLLLFFPVSQCVVSLSSSFLIHHGFIRDMFVSYD